ncbi:MAG: hypothetical protein M0P30_14250 [Syntrophorhabdaceae bacterium]|jgi:hypothetical protein|nr:hypothetical protein [Syntrophorhabdaceae bacterium]HOC46158.1 hypothetical protein [Syntrophorhabdaceae bacterium]
MFTEKSELQEAIAYTSKLKSQLFSLQRWSEALYNTLESLGMENKAKHLSGENIWFAMYFILPEDLRKRVDKAIQEAMDEFERDKKTD